jgi:hypothetical protein
VVAIILQSFELFYLIKLLEKLKFPSPIIKNVESYLINPKFKLKKLELFKLGLFILKHSSGLVFG